MEYYRKKTDPTNPDKVCLTNYRCTSKSMRLRTYIRPHFVIVSAFPNDKILAALTR